MPDKIRIRPVKQIPAAFTSLSHPILPMPRFPAAVRHGKNSTPARLALSLGRGLGEGERSHHSRIAANPVPAACEIAGQNEQMPISRERPFQGLFNFFALFPSLCRSSP
jgi:hypothetical protein